MLDLLPREVLKNDTMKNITLLLLLCLLYGCAKTIEVGNEKRSSETGSPNLQGNGRTILNEAKIEHKDNVIEIHQEFQVKNEKGEWLGMIHPLELKEISFVRMSAFTLDLESDCVVQFRIFDKGEWGDWTVLPKSKEQLNPKRKVFDGINILGNIGKIQYKSNSATQSPVVVRLFVALKQN